MSFLSLFTTLCFLGGAAAITVNDCPSTIRRDNKLQVYGNSCFEFVVDKDREEEEAEKDCESRGGFLASIESAAVNHWIMNELQTTYGHRTEDFWLGIHDRNNELDHEWEDGKPVTYSNWAPNHGPNARGFGHYVADCAVFRADDGLWYDSQCASGPWNAWGLFYDYEMPYICRYWIPEVKEEPSSTVAPKPTTKVTEKATTEATKKVTDKATTEATKKVTDKATTEATTKVTEKATTDATTKVTNKATTEATKKVTDKATTEATTKVTDKATTDATTKLTDKATTEATRKVTDKEAAAETTTTKENDPLSDYETKCGPQPECDEDCGLAGHMKVDGCLVCDCIE